MPENVSRSQIMRIIQRLEKAQEKFPDREALQEALDIFYEELEIFH